PWNQSSNSRSCSTIRLERLFWRFLAPGGFIMQHRKSSMCLAALLPLLAIVAASPATAQSGTVKQVTLSGTSSANTGDFVPSGPGDMPQRSFRRPTLTPGLLRFPGRSPAEAFPTVLETAAKSRAAKGPNPIQYLSQGSRD